MDRLRGMPRPEVCDRIIRLQVVPGDPLVVRVIVALPLDQVLDPTIPLSRIEDLFDFEMLDIVNNDGVGGSSRVASREGVGGERCQLYDWEDRVKSRHGFRKFESTCTLPHCLENLEGSKSKAVELLACSIRPNI